MTASPSPLSAYRGLRVLVTGDTGFKGSWLCAWLLALGADVTGFALPPEEPSHFELLGLRTRLRHVDGDLRDAEHVVRLTREIAPHVVFHMGAQPLVRESYTDPVATFATNVMGTAHVLEGVRHTPDVRAAVIVTSDKCYENAEWVWAYRESDRLGGHDPYSASKGACELVVSSYRRSFFGAKRPGLGVASARAGNVIGGGDWAKDRLVPDCARTLLEGRTLVLRNPRAVRPWQHVLEPLSGYLALGAKLLSEPARFSDAYNFGPNDRSAVDVESIARTFRAEFASGEIVCGDDADNPHEAKLLRLACEKAQVELGWTSLLTAQEAVAWTAQWYKVFRTDARAAPELTQRQLNIYQERLKAAEARS